MIASRAGPEAEAFPALLAGLVLQLKVVACYLPHLVAGSGLGSQEEVMVKLVAFNLHCSNITIRTVFWFVVASSYTGWQSTT